MVLENGDCGNSQRLRRILSCPKLAALAPFDTLTSHGFDVIGVHALLQSHDRFFPMLSLCALFARSFSLFLKFCP